MAETKESQVQDQTLEEKFERLDVIAERLEDRDTPLDESFALYKEGMDLVKSCGEMIDSVEKKMKQVNEDGTLSDF